VSCASASMLKPDASGSLANTCDSGGGNGGSSE
jgi:hypothetical protein